MVACGVVGAESWGKQPDWSAADKSENGMSCVDVWDGGLGMPSLPSSSCPRDSVTSSVVRTVVCDGDARDPVNINANSSNSKKYTRVLSPRM